MANWTSDELNKIGIAEELLIASKRSDGTLRKQVTIWVIRLGDEIFVRSVKGRNSWWFIGILTCHEGRIQAGGVEKDVRFVEVQDLNDEVDAVYRKKYSHYPANYVNSIISPDARTAMLKLIPI